MRALIISTPLLARNSASDMAPPPKSLGAAPPRARRALLVKAVYALNGQPHDDVDADAPCTLADEVAHITGALDAVAASEAGVHLVAHSYGGLVALQLAQQLGTRVRSLFLYEPVLFGALLRTTEQDVTVDAAARPDVETFAKHPWFLTDDARMGTSEWLETFIDYWNRPGSWARMPEPQRAETEAAAWKMAQEVRGIFTDPADFGAYAHPAPTTLVLGGRTTAASRATTHTLMARALPHAVLVELPKAGHMGPLTHRAEVHAELAEHFRRLAAGQACVAV